MVSLGRGLGRRVSARAASAEGCWKGGELTFGEECWVVMGADQQQHPPADSVLGYKTDLTGGERDARRNLAGSR